MSYTGTNTKPPPNLAAPSLSLSVPPYIHRKDDHLVALVVGEEDDVFHSDPAVVLMSDAVVGGLFSPPSFTFPCTLRTFVHTS